MGFILEKYKVVHRGKTKIRNDGEGVKDGGVLICIKNQNRKNEEH